ncbi:cupin domain-containing protein [Sulfitobacter pacificus]|uniref:Cupin n=1 Tax=Sulfitobacter pacificus TaxID=1499314 RepID=A0ABQ5VJ44_9RHOB|nr:cupin domain-containing protein [Sulfitobacter pacificus]GLQ27089.1 cupin [Sulfitobacter pacificus]
MPIITKADAKRDRDDGKDNPCGPFEAILYSSSGGLSQFGAFVEILPPGSASSVKHWHAREDEMIYMLEGIATVLEGDEEHQLTAGDAATFKAGTAVGHCVQNRSDQPVRYLVIGTRSPADTVTYPDHNRVLHFARDDSGNVVERRYVTAEGAPADSPYKINDNGS